MACKSALYGSGRDQRDKRGHRGASNRLHGRSHTVSVGCCNGSKHMREGSRRTNLVSAPQPMSGSASMTSSSHSAQTRATTAQSGVKTSTCDRFYDRIRIDSLSLRLKLGLGLGSC